ncbi:Hypothetical protein FKW44_011489 [Caligus rogercresseyi]|uniref:Uncharacterized protein n=1 Tax=Caligus rogercresseyi TaxID=217165 RepID=A0A7T8HI29_CALRO|nr:Hypothetical protein FKW44_011489 [Caligus rogercresseyi]
MCGPQTKGLRVPCGVQDFHFLPDAEAVRPQVARGGKEPPDVIPLRAFTFLA